MHEGEIIISVHSLTQDSRNALNRSTEPDFLIYSSRFQDGFERLLAEATFRTPWVMNFSAQRAFKSLCMGIVVIVLLHIIVYLWKPKAWQFNFAR